MYPCKVLVCCVLIIERLTHLYTSIISLFRGSLPQSMSSSAKVRVGPLDAAAGEGMVIEDANIEA